MISRKLSIPLDTENRMDCVLYNVEKWYYARCKTRDPHAFGMLSDLALGIEVLATRNTRGCTRWPEVYQILKHEMRRADAKLPIISEARYV